MSKSALDQPSAARFREIAELAEFIAEEHWQNGGIDLESIAQQKKITLSFNDYDDAFDGMLEHRTGRFHIYCNLARLTRRDSPRARFTLGHEFGHFFIDEHRLALESGAVPGHRSLCDYESRNPVEREADHFASNLLLPESRFRNAAKRSATGLAGILKLADQFNASVTSTAIRFASLNVRPCALIKWSDARIAWKWLSGSTREAGFRVTISDAAKLPCGSPTARALAGEPVAATFFESGTTASAWFPFVSPESVRNVLLIEQAITLGRFGVLTFLYPESGTFDFGAWQ